MRGVLLIFLSLIVGACFGAGLFKLYSSETNQPEVVYIEVPASDEPNTPPPIDITTLQDIFDNRQDNEGTVESLLLLETRIRQMESIIAETNRELSELRFRVDTHSESFRPFQEISPNPNHGISSSPGGGTPLLPFSPDE